VNQLVVKAFRKNLYLKVYEIVLMTLHSSIHPDKIFFKYIL